MKSNKTFLGLFILALAAMLAITSCEKDLNPYSETKDESFSLIGFTWNGEKYTQSVGGYLGMIWTRVNWGIVEIESEKNILITAGMNREGLSSLNMTHVWMIIPYPQDVVMGQQYSTTVYPSYVLVYSHNPAVIMDGKEWTKIVRPVTVSITFTKKGNTIQGKFTAEGDALEMADGEKVSVKLEKGELSLSYANGYVKNYSLESWLSEIELDKKSAKELAERTSRQQ